eukprot:431340_1
MPALVKAQRGFRKKKKPNPSSQPPQTNVNNNSHDMDIDSVSDSENSIDSSECKAQTECNTSAPSTKPKASINYLKNYPNNDCQDTKRLVNTMWRIKKDIQSIQSVQSTKPKASINYLKNYPNNDCQDTKRLVNTMWRIKKDIQSIQSVQSTKPIPIQYTHLLGTVATSTILEHRYNGIKLIRDGASVEQINQHVQAFDDQFDVNPKFSNLNLNTPKPPSNAIKLVSRSIRKRVAVKSKPMIEVGKITVGSFIYTCNGLALVTYTKRNNGRYVEATVLDNGSSSQFDLDEPMDVAYVSGDVVEYSRKQYCIKQIDMDGSMLLVNAANDSGFKVYNPTRLKLVHMDRSLLESSTVLKPLKDAGCVQYGCELEMIKHLYRSLEQSVKVAFIESDLCNDAIKKRIRKLKQMAVQEEIHQRADAVITNKHLVSRHAITAFNVNMTNRAAAVDDSGILATAQVGITSLKTRSSEIKEMHAELPDTYDIIPICQRLGISIPSDTDTGFIVNGRVKDVRQCIANYLERITNNPDWMPDKESRITIKDGKKYIKHQIQYSVIDGAGRFEVDVENMSDSIVVGSMHSPYFREGANQLSAIVFSLY